MVDLYGVTNSHLAGFSVLHGVAYCFSPARTQAVLLLTVEADFPETPPSDASPAA